ncbi:4Fe-4S binding protein [Endozoicomonas numazuensis]|uniref:4Fe-4S binding protein n=1 Tax=Endozoicomonas numazuensis TaxID=1137799 RepID=UPI0012687BCF
MESCETGALSVQLKKKARVDTELCTGCGECALDCHSRAILLRFYSDCTQIVLIKKNK